MGALSVCVGGQMKMAPASLTDGHLEDNSSIKSRWKFPFWNRKRQRQPLPVVV